MKINLIKAWKDEEYRSTLNESQIAEISNPAGNITLSDSEMNKINGGSHNEYEPNTINKPPEGVVASFQCCYLIN